MGIPEVERNDAVLADSIAATDVRAELTDLLSRVLYRNERIPITKNGKVVAYLVSPEDMERLITVEK